MFSAITIISDVLGNWGAFLVVPLSSFVMFFQRSCSSPPPTAEQNGIRASLLKQNAHVRRSFGEIFDIRAVEINIYHVR